MIHYDYAKRVDISDDPMNNESYALSVSIIDGVSFNISWNNKLVLRCFDLMPCDDDFGRDITLDELIDKVRDYPCMAATWRLMYEWAKMNGNLLALSRGDQDTFCDGNDIIK